MPRYSNLRIYPHQRGIPSARTLARALNGLVIKRQGSRFSQKRRHLVVNWGASDCPYDVHFNQPEAVRVASNKEQAFVAMERSGVTIPKFTTDKAVARNWDTSVVVRRLLNSYAGRGIEVVDTECHELPDAPLYTEYVPKTDEYRVHVMRDNAFFVQRKARSYACDNPNWQIRNHDNGFVFAHNENRPIPDDVVTQAVKAVDSIGLDFGAVDVVWNKRREKAYVLEVNTAPGLTGETITKYASQIGRYLW